MTSNKCCLFSPDLRELLEKIDLAKYFSVFQEQEVIDYVKKFPVFSTIFCSDRHHNMFIHLVCFTWMQQSRDSRPSITDRSADCFVRSVLCNRPYMVSFFKVDLPTFMTLTDKDLKELGISTFGIRKKILVTIQGNLRFSFFFFSMIFLSRTLKNCTTEEKKSTCEEMMWICTNY